jgi:hydrogenase maturation protease
MDPVARIADAVLYEGYVLWPYRRSALKNQRRWTFGGIFPPAHSRAHPDDRCRARTQCLVQGDPEIEVAARFLQVVRRQAVDAHGRALDELVAGGRRHLSWDEAVEREAGPGVIAIPAGSAVEELGSAGALHRSWQALAGEVAVGTEPLGDGLHRITVDLINTTPFAGDDREAALHRTFCSAHAVLRARAGAFVSLTDPPVALRDAARRCVNDGLWPVLVGEPGRRDTMLAAPIILEDHPRVAPESPGDLFDGGEIDELLALNILSLTDAEKAEMRASDPRTREILERTEALTRDDLLRLHGAWR